MGIGILLGMAGIASISFTSAGNLHITQAEIKKNAIAHEAAKQAIKNFEKQASEKIDPESLFALLNTTESIIRSGA